MTGLEYRINRAILVLFVLGMTLGLVLYLAGVAQLWPYLGALGLGLVLAVLNEVRLAGRSTAPPARGAPPARRPSSAGRG